MARHFHLVFLFIMVVIIEACGGGHDDHKYGGSPPSTNSGNYGDTGGQVIPYAQMREKHLVRFIPNSDGSNEIEIVYATDKNGVLQHMVTGGREVAFYLDKHKVDALIESNCEGYPEVAGGGPGLRIPFCNPAKFKINRPGDIMIPGLLVNDKIIYSLNIDFVDVEGPSGAIFIDKGRGLINWGTAAVTPDKFACDKVAPPHQTPPPAEHHLQPQPVYVPLNQNINSNINLNK